MKFRKKPVEVEAIQYVDYEGAYDLLVWINEGQKAKNKPLAMGKGESLIIPTLEGEIIASVGDWIIKGVAGEFYPCKPDIFMQTYEEVQP